MKVWYIQAFINKTPIPTGGFNIDDVVEVIVEADEEDEALLRAKNIIKRNHYRVFKVWDKPEDTFNDEVHMKSLEIQAEMLKVVKGVK